VAKKCCGNRIRVLLSSTAATWHSFFDNLKQIPTAGGWLSFVFGNHAERKLTAFCMPQLTMRTYHVVVFKLRLMQNE
jgi:hypothetical protein